MSEQALIVSPTNHLMPAMTMALARERYGNLVAFVKTLMKDGIDYGTIPGTGKPTLYKPGAERLCTFFGLAPTFSIIEKEEDWDGLNHGGEPFFYYWFRCHIHRDSRQLSEADGSCNSRESKYRWRWVNESDLPPGVDKAMLAKRGGTISEFDFAVDKAETGGKYGKPAEYWQAFKDAIANGTARETVKDTKGGKQYKAWEIDSALYRVPNDDIASQVNTIQKMAQKRALVAAVLIAANASEFFTQDLEDLDEGFIEATFRVVSPQPPQPAPPAAGPMDGEVEPTNGNHQDAGINSPQALLAAVNEAADNHYTSIPHMLNAYRKHTGEDKWGWPSPNDVAGYKTAFDVLVDYAKANAPK